MVMEWRQVRTDGERGQSFSEIAVTMAVMAAVLALAIFVVVPAIRPGESSSQRDAYIRAVATQQAQAYAESVATQRAETSSADVAPGIPSAADANPAQSNVDANSDRREA